MGNKISRLKNHKAEKENRKYMLNINYNDLEKLLHLSLLRVQKNTDKQLFIESKLYFCSWEKSSFFLRFCIILEKTGTELENCIHLCSPQYRKDMYLLEMVQIRTMKTVKGLE